MSRSLDELIEFLLERIALGGDTGITFLELAAFVQQFYQPVPKPKDDCENPDEADPSTRPARYALDRPLLSKVWIWLARHPDVSIGKNRRFNDKTLDDVEELYPKCIKFSSGNEVAGGTAPLLMTTTPYVNNVPDPQSIEYAEEEIGGPRLFVNEERISIAICGHPPDPTRVFASEWPLLLHIAASRDGGMLQGDLVRATGQDKRSVPKRTDALHEKGYITKQVVYIKGNKTSRLYLRRFAEAQQSSDGSGGSKPEQLTVRHVARHLFDVLKNNPLIPQEDLGDALGMTRPGRARILSQLIRYFGRSGCLKRVRTAFGPSARSKDLKTCVQYLKEPAYEEWEAQSTQEVDLDQPVEVIASMYEAEAGHSSGADTYFDNVIDSTEQIDLSVAEDELAGSIRTVLPQWNPDRILANVLLEAAQVAGPEGLGILSARKIITGPFIKRTLESLLVKISNKTLQAQPASLKHLAILRALKFQNGISQYIHYAFATFAEQVKSGQAKWQDVSGGEQFLKQLTKVGKDVSAVTELADVDTFGFALRTKPISQAHNGEVTMSKLLHDAKITKVQSRVGEPSLFEMTPGHSQFGLEEDSSTQATIVQRRGRPRREPFELQSTAIMDEYGQRTKGRPRKFTRGTEKYWRDVFAFIIQERDPEYIKENGKAGVTNDPTVLRIFQKRPTDFDKTVLQAIDFGLPVASTSRDISQDWVDKIKAIMKRTQPGLYITPAGYHPGSRRRNAQTLILRSPRLRELDWVDRRKFWPWQQLSSSTSHSLRYQRFYPRLGVTPRHIVVSLRLPKNTLKSKTKRNRLTPGPPRGTFYEDINPPLTEPPAQVIPQAPANLDLQGPLRLGDITDATDSDPGIQNHTDEAAEPQSPLARTSKTGHEDSPPLTRSKKNVCTASSLTASRRSLRASTRSSRQRILTKKAAENMESNGAESRADGTGSINLADSVKTDLGRTELRVSVPATPPDSISEKQSIAMQLDVPSINMPTESVVMSDQDIESSRPDLTMPHVAQPSVSETRGASDFETRSNAGINDCFMSQLHEHAEGIEDTNHDETLTLTQRQILPDSDVNLVEDPNQIVIASNNIEIMDLPAVDATIPVTEKVSIQLLDRIAKDTSKIAAASSRKRSRAAVEDSDFTPEPERSVQNALAATPARKRTRTEKVHNNGSVEIARSEVSKLCRILILELVGLCSGLAPNVPWTLRRAMVTRWHEAGVKADQLNAKNVRAAIRALCENGKLKQITFAFRGKSGTMVKMSIIALQSMDATNPAVVVLQQKMSELAPADYVPPELEAEAQRAPNQLNKKRYSKEINREESEGVVEKTPNKSKAAKKPRVTKALKSSTVLDVEQTFEQQLPRPSSPVEALIPLCSPSPEPVATPNTGFLTLHVPRLRELNISAEYQYKYKLPPVPLRFETDPTLSRSTKAEATPIVGRRSGLQRNRTVKFDPGTHKLIWKKPRNLKLPSSLDNIPNIQVSRDAATFGAISDSRSARFEAEVNCVAEWEEKSPELIDGTRAESPIFINHTFTAETSDSSWKQQSLRFEALVQFNQQTADLVEVDFPVTESWPLFATALEPEHRGTTKAVGGRVRRPTKRKAELEDDVDDEEYSVYPAKRRRKDPSTQATRRSLRTALDRHCTNVSAPVPHKRNRLTQLLRYMTEEQKYEVVVAVLIVRTLVGGIEKFINWQIVSRLLPTREEQTVRDAWKTISNRYRGDVSDLTESLQHKYLEALTKGNAPSINFDSIYTSDWEGVYQWALTNLDKSIVKKIEELPSSRTQLLRRNDYGFQESKGVRELFAYNTVQTVPRKEEVLSGTVFGKPIKATATDPTPLGSPNQGEDEESDIELSRAKSWVMATLLTPEATFRAVTAQTKLLTLAPTPQKVEALLERTIKCLQRDKLIARSRRILNIGAGRGAGGPDQHFTRLRQFEGSARFFEQFGFRRLITTSMLTHAVKYKLEVLDQAYNHGGSITVAKDTALDDGEMVAILNLFAMGMLRMRPGMDVPASRWGLDWQKHGYTTRMIDKKILGFSVIVTPIQHSYVAGDPLVTTRAGPSATIPRGEIDQPDGQGRIPVWFDITHEFQAELWEMVLGAVIGLVSTRPGIHAREIARTVWYGVSVMEVEMVLGWAEGLDLVRRTNDGAGAGWESGLWWWVAVGVGGGWRVDGQTDEQTPSEIADQTPL